MSYSIIESADTQYHTNLTSAIQHTDDNSVLTSENLCKGRGTFMHEIVKVKTPEKKFHRLN